MTRVILSRSVLDYCEGMAELVREVCEKPTISGVAPRRSKAELFPMRKDIPALHLDGLLQPPEVAALDAFLFPPEDKLDSIVHITALGAYGVLNVYVTLVDERGNQIESGFALQDHADDEDWYYFPSASLRTACGASVTVRAIAMDPLGGVGIRDEHVTV